jgi:hypothetical protein
LSAYGREWDEAGMDFRAGPGLVRFVPIGEFCPSGNSGDPWRGPIGSLREKAAKVAAYVAKTRGAIGYVSAETSTEAPRYCR